jgi:serine/threonine protein kinase/Flp pilus assembly protein TadD
MGKLKENIECLDCGTRNNSDRSYCSHCGKVLKPGASTLGYSERDGPEDGLHFEPGELFAQRYCIIEEIGRGGMGRVYKVKDLGLEIEAALKMIRPEYAQDPKFIDIFRNETILARAISQKNIIRIFDIGEDRDIKYISMEYIKGQNLGELIRQSGILAVETAIHLSKQICHGLKAAHEEGVVHCDLKPQNIMVDSNGQVHIMDFGIAKSSKMTSRECGTQLFGTPAYFSPEQAMGLPPDERSDIYSLGCIMYEMLTGEPPFSADSQEGYVQHHVNTSPKKPSGKNPKISSHLEKTILKCLEKERENRFDNAEEVCEHLQLHEPSEFDGKKRSLFKSKRFIAGALLASAILVTGIYFAFLKPSPAKSGRYLNIAILPLRNQLDDYNLGPTATFQEGLYLDLNQSTLLRAIPPISVNGYFEEDEINRMSQYPQRGLSRLSKDYDIHYFIGGYCNKSGGEDQLSVSIFNATTYEIISSRNIPFGTDQILEGSIDELTDWIKHELHYSRYEIMNDIDDELKNITTDSLEAMQHYFKGIGYYYKGEFRKSIFELENAVGIDPEFAIAFRQLSVLYGYVGDREKKEETANKAYVLSQNPDIKISKRERNVIQLNYRRRVLNQDLEAIEPAERILSDYPEDMTALGELIAIHRKYGHWKEIEKYSEILIGQNINLGVYNLVIAYLAQGYYNKAILLLGDMENRLDPYIFSINMANAYLCQMDCDQALFYISKATSTNPEDFSSLLLEGNIFHLRGDWEKARNSYQQLSDLDNIRNSLTGQEMLSALELQLGNFTAAETILEEQALSLQTVGEYSQDYMDSLLSLTAVQLRTGAAGDASLTLKILGDIIAQSPEGYYHRRHTYLSGLVYQQRGQIGQAEHQARRLEAMYRNVDNLRNHRYLHHLLGRIDHAAGNYGSAIRRFEKAFSFLSKEYTPFDEHAYILFDLAHSHLLDGDLNAAKDTFERITRLSTGRLSYGELYALSFYWLGRISLELSNAPAAKDHFEAFLDLWGNASDSHPAIRDCRKRLRELEGSLS